MLDEANVVNSVVNEQYSLLVFPSLRHCLPFFGRNLWNGNGFCIFVVRVTLIKIMNTPFDRSSALFLSIINLTYCSCTGICQIRLEIWPEPDLVGFTTNGQIPDLPEPQPKSGTSLLLLYWWIDWITKHLYQVTRLNPFARSWFYNATIVRGAVWWFRQSHSVNYANHQHSPGGGTTLQTPFSPVSFGKRFMKIRSAVPENGCLIFFCGRKKTKKHL